MAVRVVEIKDIGPVLVARRKGSRHIKLSTDSRGRVRLSLPYYVPVSAGLLFAASKKEWLKTQLKKHLYFQLVDGARIGKSYTLNLKSDAHNPKTRTARLGKNLYVYNYDGSVRAQALVENAATKCLKNDSEDLLIPRLEHLAEKHGYKFKTATIKVLRSRWGSCSSAKSIALSVFLIQLPWDLIDYVLMHELAHTKHLNHGRKFWYEMESNLPDCKARRRELKKYRPTIFTQSS